METEIEHKPTAEAVTEKDGEMPPESEYEVEISEEIIIAENDNDTKACEKITELVPMDLTKCKIGREYEISVKGGEVKTYKINYMNLSTGALAMNIPSKERPGKKDNVTVNAKDCKIKRYTSADQQRKDAEEQAKYDLKQLEKERKRLEEVARVEEKNRQDRERRKQQQELKEQQKRFADELLKDLTSSENSRESEDIILEMIKNGIYNIWMVGPAGCGKSTIARIVAEKLGRDIHVMSCGIGTSSTEFMGYKYPEREATPFSKFYIKPSIIVLDEFTALDPSVAQIANAALANDELYTTTGLIKRHSDCIIIATSNTFGTGGDMSYVANNQLDASTIDRFVGGVIYVDYSAKYESQFNEEAVTYVKLLRNTIKHNSLQRIASTRMIINGEKLKKSSLPWKSILISNWTDEEKQLLIFKSHG